MNHQEKLFNTAEMRIQTNIAKKLSVLVVGLFFLLFSYTSIAQRDLITTQAGEQIRCRILEETPSRFIYAYLGPNNKVLRNEIFKNLVKTFQYNNFPTDLIVKGQQLPNTMNKSKDSKLGSTPAETPKEETKSSRKKKSEEKVAEKSVEKPAEKPKQETVKVEKPAAKPVGEKVVEHKVETPKSEGLGEPEPTVKDSATVADKGTEREKNIEKLIKEIHQDQTETKDANPFSEKNMANEFKNYLKYRVGLRGGISNMINKNTATDEYSLYKEKLMRGWNIGADAAYFFNDHIGFGAMFNSYQSRNRAESITYKNEITDSYVTGLLATNRSVRYVGPVLYLRKNIDFKTMVVLGLSPGMYFYKDQNTYGAKNYDFKGRALGGAATLGIDFLLGNDIIGRDIILSLEAGYSYGKITTEDRGNGNGAITLPTPMDLQRLDFSVGLRFMRFPKYLRLTSY